MRAELQSGLDLARTLPTEDLPRLLGELEEIRAVVQMRIVTPAVAAKSGEEWLDVEQVAARLHKSPDWIYRNAKKWNFVRRAGKTLLFNSAALDSFLKKSK